jgi:hypothetical protein
MRKPIQGLLGLGDPEYDYLILQALVRAAQYRKLKT